MPTIPFLLGFRTMEMQGLPQFRDVTRFGEQATAKIRRKGRQGREAKVAEEGECGDKGKGGRSRRFGGAPGYYGW
jgi:hypothetical protein